jgi:hypothetical protein
MWSLAEYLAGDPGGAMGQGNLGKSDAEPTQPASHQSPDDVALARSIAKAVSNRVIYVDGSCGVLPPAIGILSRGSNKVRSYRLGFDRNQKELFNSGLLVMQYGVGRPEPTPDEYEILLRYVANGGRLLLLCPTWVWMSYDKKPLEDLPYRKLAAAFGLDLRAGYVTPPITIEAPGFRVDGADGILQGTFSAIAYPQGSGAFPIAVGRDGNAAGVAATKGAARIVVWGQSNLLSDEVASSPGGKQFLEKVVGWLLSQEESERGSHRRANGRVRTDRREE